MVGVKCSFSLQGGILGIAPICDDAELGIGQVASVPVFTLLTALNSLVKQILTFLGAVTGGIVKPHIIATLGIAA